MQGARKYGRLPPHSRSSKKKMENIKKKKKKSMIMTCGCFRAAYNV